MNKNIQVSAEKKQAFTVRILLMKETLYSYLPMIMLSALFLFSIWLVRSVKQEQKTLVRQAVSHIADYDFQNFHMKSYELNGKLKSSLQGKFAQHYLDTKNTEVNFPYVLLYTKDRIISINAKKAIVNEEGTQLQLIGQAILKKEGVVLKKEDMQITGEFLHYYSSTDTLMSHLPVQINRGNNSFKADKFKADNLNQIFELKGNVHAILAVN